MPTISLKTLTDTERLAKKIVGALKGGEVIALSGPLGSGKTTFTQALARALGIKRGVKSPTFVVIRIHEATRVRRHETGDRGQGKRDKRRGIRKNETLSLVSGSLSLRLCHVDAYRLHNIEELEAIGLADYLAEPHTITVIEWAEKIKKALPPNTLWLIFSFSNNKRTVTIKRGLSAFGQHFTFSRS